MRSRFLEERRNADSDLTPHPELVAALFTLEISKLPQDIERILATLLHRLAADDYRLLRGLIALWLK
ncbi:MAG: hypothetical protein KDH88_11160 [Chromatiales bacterium]|nr:hypothetical protein [Chromatiales bacterium]